jgi:uncharacterized lipoprotein YddW (UPF0748 family)
MVREGLRTLRGIAFLAMLASFGLQGCLNHRTNAASLDLPPAAPREFRAVWVATVANIDWPSNRRLSVDNQKTEAKDIITQAHALGLNAIILQVRPAADALYASPLEPWSEYLTGEQGKPPDPHYDPLTFWIEEAHKAGIELHAWFNPYRARPSAAQSPLAANHVANTRTNLVKTYGDQLWLDPGEPAAAEHVLAVVLDVVHRYDVDGVHFDDYFYPYPIKDGSGQKMDFPDEPSWQAFLTPGGTLSRADWRRRNVDRFVERVYREVHREKPHVRVGVSPFGIGRPDRRPPGVAGFSQYDELYAHAELWLEQGWVDYLVPQLYWKLGSTDQPFAPLLAYWRAQNPKGRHVWPGLFTSRLGASEPWATEEITGQIQLTRSPAGKAGHAHFSMVALKKNYGGITERLAEIYGGPALVPTSEWLGGTAPPQPSVRLLRSATDPTALRVEQMTGDASCLMAVWGRYGPTWRFFTLPRGAGTIPVRSEEHSLDLAFASSVGRTGLESSLTVIQDLRN